MISHTFQSVFAVRMTCGSCVNSITEALLKVPGIEKVKCNLDEQLVTIEGRAAPSAIASAIQGTGRDAILRGSGTSNSAAVCILETHAPSVQDPVRGLARMVQVSPNTIVIDLALKGLPSGEYYATIREKGDISQGAMSTGGIWEDSKGHLCKLEVDPKGTASVLLDKQVAIWELIGRSMVVSRQQEGAFEQNLEDTLVGVIARSAGVWENDKTVCSCSGKTIWEERQEVIAKGMI